MAIVNSLLTKSELSKLDAQQLARLDGIIEREMTKPGFSREQKVLLRMRILSELHRPTR